MLTSGANAAPLDMKDERGVRWICGGAGADERRELAVLESQANLKLLLVTEKRGGYLADVEVSLFERGADPHKLQRTVLAFPAEPWDGVWASDEEKAQARAP